MPKTSPDLESQCALELIYLGEGVHVSDALKPTFSSSPKELTSADELIASLDSFRGDVVRVLVIHSNFRISDGDTIDEPDLRALMLRDLTAVMLEPNSSDHASENTEPSQGPSSPLQAVLDAGPVRGAFLQLPDIAAYAGMRFLEASPFNRVIFEAPKLLAEGWIDRLGQILSSSGLQDRAGLSVEGGWIFPTLVDGQVNL